MRSAAHPAGDLVAATRRERAGLDAFVRRYLAGGGRDRRRRPAGRPSCCGTTRPEVYADLARRAAARHARPPAPRRAIGRGPQAPVAAGRASACTPRWSATTPLEVERRTCATAQRSRALAARFEVMRRAAGSASALEWAEQRRASAADAGGVARGATRGTVALLELLARAAGAVGVAADAGERVVVDGRGRCTSASPSSLGAE